MKDYYALLGVAPETTPEVLRRAYRDRAQEAMWDRPRFAAITEAWETLKDPAARQAYDQQRQAFLGQTPQPAAQGEQLPVVAAPANQDQDAFAGGAAGTQAAMNTGETIAGPGGPQEVCPICNTPGTRGERFCLECGFLLGSTPGVEAPQRPRPRLHNEAGREWVLKAGENTVGREGVDVSLGERTVSRRHARIVWEDDGTLWLEDLNSTNGTQRAGHALPPGQRALLGDGTHLQFGAAKVTLLVPDALSALPLPDPTASGREPVAALSPPQTQAAEASPTRPAPPTNDAPREPPVRDARATSAFVASDNEEPVAKLVGKNGQVYALTETMTTFGRRATNHFVLSGDPYVSGAHAQVMFDGSAFALIDLGSTNGTQLNGRKLSAHVHTALKDRDEILMGRTPLTFHTRWEPGDGAVVETDVREAAA